MDTGLTVADIRRQVRYIMRYFRLEKEPGINVLQLKEKAVPRPDMARC